MKPFIVIHPSLDELLKRDVFHKSAVIAPVWGAQPSNLARSGDARGICGDTHFTPVQVSCALPPTSARI